MRKVPCSPARGSTSVKLPLSAEQVMPSQTQEPATVSCVHPFRLRSFALCTIGRFQVLVTRRLRSPDTSSVRQQEQGRLLQYSHSFI